MEIIQLKDLDIKLEQFIYNTRQYLMKRPCYGLNARIFFLIILVSMNM